MNPYDVLGVTSSSSLEEIEKAYRDLAKKYHPDRNPDDPEAEKNFKNLQTAYDLLKKSKASSYSSFQEGMRFRTRSGFNDFDIDVNDFFSKSVFKGRNIQSKVEVTLLEVLTGCSKEVSIKKRLVCSSCSGQGFTDFVSCEECEGRGSVQVQQPPFVLNRPCGFCGGAGRINVKKCGSCSGLGYSSYENTQVKIQVPSGVENGSQIVLEGEGEPSLKGGKNGDLIVLIVIKNDPLFKREGPHISIDVPVSYTQIVLGCDLIVPCVSGEKVVLKVPPLTQPTTKFRIKGKGIPYKGDLGDMVAHLKLEVPKDLDEDYKKSLEALSFFEKKYITVGRATWLEKFGDSKQN